MPKSRNVVTVGSLLGVLLCVGCSNTSSNVAVGQGERSEDGTFTIERTVVIHDASLARRLALENAKTRFRSDLLQVDLDLRNKTRRDIKYEYRFRWLDNEGLEVAGGHSAWRPGVLGGKSVKSIQAIAPNVDATSYQIEIRRPHPIDKSTKP